MAPKPCVPSSGRFFNRTITTVTVQNLHDSDDLDLLAAGVTERVELESRVLVLRADAGISDDHQTYLVRTLILLRYFLRLDPRNSSPPGVCGRRALR